MINWNEMSELHVVSKLESILQRWFKVELFFADLNGKIHSKQFQKDYSSENPIFKLMLQTSHGYDVFIQDVEEFISSKSDSDLNLDLTTDNTKPSLNISDGVELLAKGQVSPVNSDGGKSDKDSKKSEDFSFFKSDPVEDKGGIVDGDMKNISVNNVPIIIQNIIVS